MEDEERKETNVYKEQILILLLKMSFSSNKSLFIKMWKNKIKKKNDNELRIIRRNFFFLFRNVVWLASW